MSLIADGVSVKGYYFHTPFQGFVRSGRVDVQHGHPCYYVTCDPPITFGGSERRHIFIEQDISAFADGVDIVPIEECVQEVFEDQRVA